MPFGTIPFELWMLSKRTTLEAVTLSDTFTSVTFFFLMKTDNFGIEKIVFESPEMRNVKIRHPERYNEIENNANVTWSDSDASFRKHREEKNHRNDFKMLKWKERRKITCYVCVYCVTKWLIRWTVCRECMNKCRDDFGWISSFSYINLVRLMLVADAGLT